MAASRYYAISTGWPNRIGRIGSVVRFGWTGALLTLAPVMLLATDAQQTATLLDAQGAHGRTWVCVETSDRILIGQRRGERGGMRALTGRAVSVRYDDRHLWVRGLKFQQDYLTRAFPAGSRCEQVVEAAIARRDSTEAKQLRRR